MNKVLGRNFSKKHCKDKECEEACKVNKEEESLENFDDVENFKSALYDAMKKVVKRFAHKGATLKDLESDTDWCLLMMRDDEEIPQEVKEESLKEDKEEVEVEKEVEDEEPAKDEPKLETFDEQMDFLAADEQEAIDGYDKVLALVDDEHVKEQLEHIREEEIAHKEFLEAVKSDKSLVYSHEDKEEKEEEPKDIDIDAEVEVIDDFDDIDDDFGFGESLKEDTVKRGNKWVNKGDEGTHGEFKTKKEADAQRKAMFANGFREEYDDDFGCNYLKEEEAEEFGVKVDWNDLEDDFEDEHKVCPKCHKEPCECLHEEELEEEHAKTGHIKLNKPVELKARDNK